MKYVFAGTHALMILIGLPRKMLKLNSNHSKNRDALLIKKITQNLLIKMAVYGMV